jgi:hypothetical protein
MRAEEEVVRFPVECVEAPASLTGTQASPRAGLHRLAVMNLSLGYAVLLVLLSGARTAGGTRGALSRCHAAFLCYLMDQAAETITTTESLRRRVTAAG